MDGDTVSEQRTSSPAATGGAGPFFEQHVAAYWLAQLLVRGIPPVLIDTVVTEVSFQTEHLGWHTDDFLIVCERAGAVTPKFAGQVKRSFTVSATDDECKKAIEDFWKDFNNAGLFSPADDRLLLVTLRGSESLLTHFVGLLDCARAARDAAEFEHRLSTAGFISKKSVHYCSQLCTIIGDLEGKPLTAADIWPFLRVLHVVSLDLHTSTRQTEAHIRSLLALTATDAAAGADATASWHALLEIASGAMAEARSLRRTDLPKDLQERHASTGTDRQRILRALKDHTLPVLRRIRTAIGTDFHLQRAALVQQVLRKAETAQVILVSGPAGSGKSVIGKNVVDLLSRDHFAFAFRAEEFAQAHIDEMLHGSQIPANAKTLEAILAAQDRKVVLIESVERLLEKTTRDAFSDLMTMAADDRGLCVILTCRDYSVEQVRASFLQPAGVAHAVVAVPPLDDTELAEAEAALPPLAYPLKNPALREILRNPYFLDKALEIPWSPERPVPESEREFRALFWRQIVRADQNATAGMPRRREDVFQQIAVRRARALSDYVVCNDLDPAVVAALRHDSLISSPDENPSRLAPAHDVLEDWAILQWIEELHLTGEGLFKDLSAAIGPHPAVRRSYRKWVAELVDRDPAAADRLFKAAVTETEISSQFRDDTLVSLLKAPSAPEFLIRHEAQLLANDSAILKRIIHLLRVACVTAPAWLAGATGHGSILNVPDGPAWPTVLRLVSRNIDRFTPQDRPLLLGLIEDAVRDVSWWKPELEGAEFVAGIAHWLLPAFDNYRMDEPRKRVLKVIARIPKGDPVRFEAVLRGHVREGQRHDRVADDFREILLSGIDGMQAARDLPDLVASIATESLLATEAELRQDPFLGSSLDLNVHFGIKEHLRQEFFPASAIRGPWMHLLRYHPRKGLDFFIAIFNHSADWYAHPRVHDRLESPWEVELTFADGSTRKQWVNPRLWNFYRGTQAGPYVLQSLLMAFENWLLDVAKNHPKQLDGVLVEILRRSDSAALAGVVASVATAHPHESGEALLVLLSAPDYIVFDRQRMALERRATGLAGMIPSLRGDHKIYEQERKHADGLPHRNQDLEAAVASLQFGPLATRVHAILDRHLAALPPKSEQDESHLRWRLAIHRMDVRQYTISEVTEQECPAPDGETGEVKRYIRFEPKAPEADVQAMVDEGSARFTAMNARLGVYMWALQIFQREDGSHDPSQWREKLADARLMDRETEHPDGSRHAPGFVAAVCVRDRWEEMSDDERDWCVDVVCSEVFRQADAWNMLDRSQRFDMAADRPSAFVITALMAKPLEPAHMSRVRDAFVTAITHPIEEVRWYAVAGIDTPFWAANRDVAMRSVNAIATEALLIDRARTAEERRRYDKQRPFEEIFAEAATTVRQHFWLEGAIAQDAHVTLDISEGFGAHVSGMMLAILAQAPDDPVSIAAFERASQILVDWWDADDDRKNRRDRNFHTERAVLDRLAQFLMRTMAPSAQKVLGPLLDAVDRHPREVDDIVQSLINIEDSNRNTAHFWFLWGLFAERVQKAKWIAHLDGEHPSGEDMLATIFLTKWWKDGVRHWRSLEGHAQHVDALFEALPATSIVLDDYVRFLYHIGERSLPAAFVRLADSLRRGDVQAMLRRTNTVFLLEVLLQRHVYGRPLELKRDPAVREAVLFLLDVLVENGSSAAFRMRDDFVTPAA
jgi:tRNA A37 threonylcarbamoyladenosine biosynthesis protein TsaE